MRSDSGEVDADKVLVGGTAPGGDLRSEQDGSRRPFVDSHHHLWDTTSHGYPWLSDGGDPDTTEWIGDYSSIRRPYLVDDFLRDASRSGLQKSVHIDASWGGSDAIAETRWLQAISNARGFPHAIVAAVDLRAPDAESRIDRHAESPNLRGVRMTQMGDLVAGAEFRRGFAALSRRGLSYDLNIRFGDTEHALALASAFPQTMIAIDNMANPVSLGRDYFDGWKEAMQQLATAPNVVMKISGLGMADHRWTASLIRPWVLTAVDLFSPERCMFGSNWPVDGLYSDYAKVVNAVQAAISGLDATSKESIMRSVAERVYRI
jgi:predicted TIM-barrel fold metal-dependent hydrolase